MIQIGRDLWMPLSEVSVKGEQVAQSLAQLSFEHLHKWRLQTNLDILFWCVIILTVSISFLVTICHSPCCNIS